LNILPEKVNVIRMKNKIRKTILILTVILTILLLFKSHADIHSFLKVNLPNPSAEVLICESWLSPYYYDSFIENYRAGNYTNVLVTGNNRVNDLDLFMNGAIILKNLEFPKHATKFKLHLSGTKSQGEYAIAEIYKNDSLIIQKEARFNCRIEFECSMTSTDSLVIKFINDTYDKFSDRNLTLKECKVDGTPIRLLSENNFILYKNNYSNTNYETSAEQIAIYLELHGIKNVEFITSSRSGISKTYNAATDAIRWLKQHNFQSANIIISDYHSRRTYLSYKKAGSDFRIGIIALSEKPYCGLTPSKLRIIKEVSGSVFIQLTPKFILDLYTN
jgi:hypothetical protein